MDSQSSSIYTCLKNKSLSTRRTGIAIVALAALALGGCGLIRHTDTSGANSDITSVDKKDVHVLGKTDYAEVVGVSLPAGKSLAPHQGGDRVIYSITSYKLDFDGPGGESETIHAPGNVYFRPAGEHSVENVSETTAKFVIFERLPSGVLPEVDHSIADDTPVPSTGATEEKLFSNELFDVYRISIQPGGHLAPHEGWTRAVYSLDEYDVIFHHGSETKHRTFHKGQVHFHQPGRHWLENDGNTTAEFLVVDYKK